MPIAQILYLQKAQNGSELSGKNLEIQIVKSWMQISKILIKCRWVYPPPPAAPYCIPGDEADPDSYPPCSSPSGAGISPCPLIWVEASSGAGWKSN